MKKLFALFLAMVMSLSLFAGCKKDQQPPAENPDGNKEEQPKQEEQKNKGTLNYAFTTPIAALNPHTWSSSNDGDHIENIASKLYKFYPGENGLYAFEDEMADGDPVAMNDTGTVFQIKLNKNGKWSDGKAVTADDYIYSWKMCLDPVMLNSRGSTMAEDYISIVGAKKYLTQVAAGETVDWETVGIKKIDDYTIEVTTVAKQSPEEVKTHFSQTWTAVVHPDLYEKNMAADGTTTQYGTDTDKIATCGAFKIESWIKGSEITYVRDENYVQSSRIQLEKLHCLVVKDANTRMQLFENGQIDYVALATEDIKKYEEDPRVLESPAAGVMHLVFNGNNTQTPAVADPNFRKAVFYAVDRKSLAGLVQGIPANWAVPMKKVGNVATGEIFREMESSNAYLAPNLGYDTAKAKEYFDKAYEANGNKKITVTLLYNDSSESYKMMSEFIQKTLPEIFGADRFELKLQGMPSNQIIDAQKDHKSNPNSYEMAWSNWNTNTIAPWNGLKVWSGTYGNKNEPWQNDEYDALWAKANNGEERFDPKLRLELTQQMEKILLDDAAIVPVAESPSRVLKNDRVILPSENGYIPKIGFGWIYSSIEE